MKIYGTAKGGAIGKKDFGVAFGGGAPSPSGGSCEQTVISGVVLFGVAQYGSRIGIEISTGFDCIGGAIKSVVFNFKKEGSPTGTVYARVYNSSNVLKCTLGSFDVSTTSTSLTNYTFDSPDTTYVLTDGDFIVLEYGAGTGSGYLVFSVAVGTAVSNVAYALYAPIGSESWSTDSDDSCYYQIES